MMQTGEEKMKKGVVIVGCLIGFFLNIAVADGLVGEDTPEHDKRVRKVLDELKYKYKIDSDGDFKLAFKTEGGRTQVAFIRSKTSKYKDLEIREIFAYAYKSDGDQLPADVANRLLEENRVMKLGAWQKSGKFARFSAKLSANADSDALRSVLQLVLLAADRMEKEFTGDKDAY